MQPVYDGVKQADLHKALVSVISMEVLTVCEEIDTKLPRCLLERIFLDASVQDAIASTQAAMPVRLRSPLIMLQAFTANLDQNSDVLLANCAVILQNFEDYASLCPLLVPAMIEKLHCQDAVVLQKHMLRCK